MRRKKLKITGIVFILLIITMVIASYIYVSDYYHSTNTINEYQEDTDISIVEEDSLIIVGDVENSLGGIIFYPGAKVEYSAYIPLMKEIAKEGYTCFIVKMPGNLAVLGINKGDMVIDSYPEIKNWYIAGHSLGGAMASTYAQENSEILKGIILMGAYPSSDLSKTDIKLLSIVGSRDDVLDREKYRASKSNAPLDSEYFDIEGGNHAYYGDYGEQSGDGKATITREKQIEETAKIIIDWLNVT